MSDPRVWVLLSAAFAGGVLSPSLERRLEATESQVLSVLFGELDANHDGQLEPYEAAEAALNLVRSADENDSGEATSDELSAWLRERSQALLDEVEGLVEELDQDGSHTLSDAEIPEELLPFLVNAKRGADGSLSTQAIAAAHPFESARPMIEAEFLGLLDEFDDDGDGAFLLEALDPGLEEEASEWIHDLDANGDGEVTRAELIARVDEELRGAEFEISDGVARMSGVIGPTTPARVLELIVESPEVLVIELVDVPGSMDDEANLRAARMLHHAGLRTRVAPGGEIASGGVDFFLAGHDREIGEGGRLGVHSWASGGGITGRDLARSHPDHRMFLDFYRDVDVDPEFYWFTLEAAPAESIHWMTRDEVRRFDAGAIVGEAGAPDDDGHDADDGEDPLARSHIGGCVLIDASAPVPADPFAVSPFRIANDLSPFYATITGAGIELRAEQGVSEEFMGLCAKAAASMFKEDESKDRGLQEFVASALHARRALLPVPRTEESFERLLERHGDAIERIERSHSICDIIMAEVPPKMQVMEVVEHLLHATTDVGLSTVFPGEWGLTRSSALGKAMDRAIEAGIYNIDGYEDLVGVPDPIRDRILLQEFAYWYLTTRWDLQRPYGPDEEEWTLRRPEELAAAFPVFDKVVAATADRVLSAPSAEILTAIEAHARSRR